MFTDPEHQKLSLAQNNHFKPTQDRGYISNVMTKTEFKTSVVEFFKLFGVLVIRCVQNSLKR